LRTDETRYIRGRRVVFERREQVETLRYSIDVFDERDNLIEVLGRLADLAPAQAAYEAALKKYPDKRICLAKAMEEFRIEPALRFRLIVVPVE
jgi:hypothetical protein